MRLIALVAVVLAALPGVLTAQELYTVSPASLTEWKAVYGRIEARDQIPARARLGGTLKRLDVTEGDRVSTGQDLARIIDDKLEFRLSALDARSDALQSQLRNAEAELERGEALLERGVTTAQRLDALRTDVNVLRNELDGVQADRRVIEQQVTEGTVLAPLEGRVLDVPVTEGAVVMPGEVVAMIGGNGFFLRLAVPERHANFLVEGDSIQIEEQGASQSGTLARIYPQIENGRVVADVEVPNLSDAFVNKRVLVRLPVATREALVVPEKALITRAGLDYVEVTEGDETILRSVLPGQRHVIEGRDMVEIVTGVRAGEKVVVGDE
ncbi:MULTISPECIES: efflux RND transporter periplasmic adaptor subunit [Sediminimonas]|uniref:efflux RND transporter periplasmic adaptor subunit n=1 Tax=Sediminimonas TaxID=659427 RepID=UPI00040F62E7|nr:MULTISPECIES: efflux RND transporter periplasmic adaptor subunit [Sediminimonas]MDR9484872.1 efflux RND transporter periplasmic adaptor subunit [Sediminimonas sp.]